MALPQGGPVAGPLPGDELCSILGHMPSEDSAVKFRQEFVPLAKLICCQGRGLIQQGHILSRGPGNTSSSIKRLISAGNIFLKIVDPAGVVELAERLFIQFYLHNFVFFELDCESSRVELPLEFFQVFCFRFRFHSGVFTFFHLKLFLAPFFNGASGS